MAGHWWEVTSLYSNSRSSLIVWSSLLLDSLIRTAAKIRAVETLPLSDRSTMRTKWNS